MPLFALSLLSVCRVADAHAGAPLYELAIHVVAARDEAEARERGADLGASRQLSYRNGEDADVSWVFERVVECQNLFADALSDGMEVSSWLFRGERLCLNDGWSPPPPSVPAERRHPGQKDT